MASRSEDLLTDLFRMPLDPGYAEAARGRRERVVPLPRWQRTAERVSLLVALLLTGVLLAVAYRQVVSARPTASQARADLLTDVRTRRSETDGLQRRADALHEQVTQDRDRALASVGDPADLRGLAAANGLGKVAGDGVVVRLADAAPQVDPVTGRQSTDNPGVVVDRDLQDIANTLWESGAEAVAVNGQRLTATSTIRAAGGAILVDLRPLSSPYEVTAIGPAEMLARFTDSATAKRFRRYVTSYRMEFGVKRRSAMTLAAAPDPRLRFAQPVPPAGSPAGSPSGAARVPAAGSPAPPPLLPSGPVPSGSGGNG